MAEKIDISDLKLVAFSDKGAKPFTESLADPECKLGLGSVAAYSAAFSVALMLKAVRCCPSDDPEILSAEAQFEKLRSYFVFLIDEENKAKLPLEKRLKNGAPDNEIEAGYSTACIILTEILYTSLQMTELMESVSDKVCSCSAQLCAAAVFNARNAMDCVRLQLARYSVCMKDEVTAHTTRREPEIAIAGADERLNALAAKFESMIK